MTQAARAAALQLRTSGDAPRAPAHRDARQPAVRTSSSRRGCSSLLRVTTRFISRLNPTKQKGQPNHRQALLFQLGGKLIVRSDRRVVRISISNHKSGTPRLASETLE